MKKGGNANHPKKGSRIAVDPIRQIKDIKAISKMTSGNPRLTGLDESINILAHQKFHLSCQNLQSKYFLGIIWISQNKTPPLSMRNRVLEIKLMVTSIGLSVGNFLLLTFYHIHHHQIVTSRG